MERKLRFMEAIMNNRFMAKWHRKMKKGKKQKQNEPFILASNDGSRRFSDSDMDSDPSSDGCLRMDDVTDEERSMIARMIERGIPQDGIEHVLQSCRDGKNVVLI
jgi:hypothetical protein